MSKYHARSTVIDGIRFDSLAEAKRYQQLKLRERAGEISGLRVHPQYEIQPAYCHNDKRVRSITYEPDFEYTDHATGKTVIEDVKGVQTKEFRIKKKMFEYRYPYLSISIVKA